MKYTQISDFFEDEIVNGGAELTDAKLRTFIGDVEKCKSVKVTVNFLSSRTKTHKFIVSNFINLGEAEKKFLTLNCQYIIWEHDHKYLSTRNPSIFVDMIAPKEAIRNREFYTNAKAVVCQTELHASVVRKNLGLNNIVNFGGSIWSDEELDFLVEQLNVGHQLNSSNAYQDSKMPNKGSRAAMLWCEKNKISEKGHFTVPNPIQPCSWKSFIRQLNNSSTFVFFPTVLETCSRVTVEARMLGLKIIGNQNISALQEDWFKKYKGEELVDYFRDKNKTIAKFVESCFEERKVDSVDGDITVILNLYKRPQNLQKQIEAINAQTIKPKEIWIWQNYGELEGHSPEDWIGDQQNIKWVTSNHNWKFVGRFAMAQLAQTKFVCVIDDDSIPGPEWLKNSLKTMEKYPGLIGGVGVVLTDDTYSTPHQRFGWPHPEHKIVEEVDLAGHSWVFKKEWLKYFWMEEPASWETCEDLHFSYCLQKYGNIKTYVPIQDTTQNTSSQLGYELGVDEVASSHPKNHNHFYSLRDECVKEYIKRGWKRLKK